MAGLMVWVGAVPTEVHVALHGIHHPGLLVAAASASAAAVVFAAAMLQLQHADAKQQQLQLGADVVAAAAAATLSVQQQQLLLRALNAAAAQAHQGQTHCALHRLQPLLPMACLFLVGQQRPAYKPGVSNAAAAEAPLAAALLPCPNPWDVPLPSARWWHLAAAAGVGDSLDHCHRQQAAAVVAAVVECLPRCHRIRRRHPLCCYMHIHPAAGGVVEDCTPVQVAAAAAAAAAVAAAAAGAVTACRPAAVG